MGIELHGTVGAVIFLIYLIILQLFFGLLASIVANFIHLNGVYFWIFVVGIVVMLDTMIIEVK